MKAAQIIILIFSVAFTRAQEFDLSADKNFYNLAYVKAAKQYENILKKGNTSQELLQRIGDSYFYNTDMENAANWYAVLFSQYTDQMSPEYLFRYMHSLKGIGDYRTAKKIMSYLTKKGEASDFTVAHAKNNAEGLDRLLQKTSQFTISPVSFNSPFSDFGTALYKDKIIFSSSRDSMNMLTRVYEWNNQPYLDFYEVDTSAMHSTNVEALPFSKAINSKYHEASATFNQEATIMYFTRNNFTDKRLRRDKEGFNHLKIYRSTLEQGGWSNPVEVPFNSDAYSVGQPSLSPNGKTLYFVSDMPGSIGETDIFMVEVHEDQTYSPPKNLGPKINTSGREMFPFVTDDKLYFSSDGHLGLGGLDIFESSFSEGGFSEPENLGKPLNNSMDDFAYMVDEETQKGYFSSNRAGGIGDDDIYRFKRTKRWCGQRLSGKVLNKFTDELLGNVYIALIDDANQLLAETFSSTTGEYEFSMDLACRKTYRLKASREGYQLNESILTIETEQNVTKDILLELDAHTNDLIVKEDGMLKIKIPKINFDLDKAEIREDAAKELDKIVALMTEYPNMVIKIESHTDARGSFNYNLTLSKKRALSTRDYLISMGIDISRIASTLGYGEMHLLNDCDDTKECSEAAHDVNRRSEFIIVSMH